MHARSKALVVFVSLSAGVALLAHAIKRPARMLDPGVEVPAKPAPVSTAVLPMVTADTFDVSKVRPMSRREPQRCRILDFWTHELEQGGSPSAPNVIVEGFHPGE